MPPSPATPPPLDDPTLYFNRELSWLQFNRRVLEEAQDPEVPLFERIKFLAIFSSNLDEFFMVRVGGLQQKVVAQITRGSGGDKLTPHDQLARMSDAVGELVREQARCWNEQVRPILAEHGVTIRDKDAITPGERKHLEGLFRGQIFPVLTPLAVDPGHPFPHLSNKSLNLAVQLRRPNDAEPLFALVQVPGVLPRFTQLPAVARSESAAAPTIAGGPPPEVALVPLETVIQLFLHELFPGMELQDAVPFRVTRDSEFEIEDEVDDLLRAIEENIKQRRRGHAVRLEIEAGASIAVEQFLTASLDVDPTDVFSVPGLLDMTGLFQIHALPGYDKLRDPPHAPVMAPGFATGSSLWSAIRARDILVHHPYESFKSVTDFIEFAADDDRVQAIKQTLYRTSSDSPIVKALQRAADRGKQVTAVVELKARLDEERNILWAKALEKAGVHVVYGFVGLKTHCKVAMVVRRDDDGMRRYVHLATGNYNPQTARFYTDIGLFTANPAFADDVTLLFNHLTGYAALPKWRKLVVAPSRLQNTMVEKIDREAELQRAGKVGRIVFKVNGLLEPEIVQALYRASQAGVKIDIVCRGVCALRPGVPGVSDNIRVTSVIDRFLEHSRIFYFGNDGDPDVSVGSADLMDRNLSRRVEVVFPIEQADLKARVVDEILALSLVDNVKARELLSDGTYRRVTPAPGEPVVRSQSRFVELAAESERRLNPALATTPAAPVVGSPRLVKRAKKSGGNR